MPRKSYVYHCPKTQRKAVDSHRPRRCPLDGCYAVVKRLPPHLREHHGIRDESVVKDWLRTARLNKSSLNEPGNHTDSEGDNSTDYLHDNDHDMATGPASDYDAVSEEEVEPPFAHSEDSNGFTSFDSFASWLQTADGGRKSEKSAKQHAFQAQTVATVTGKESRPLELFAKETLQAKFLGRYVKDKQFSPATIRSYLSSLIHFGNYATMQGYVSGESKSHIQTMLSCIRRWIASFRKECCVASLQKMDTDVQNLVTRADIKAFESSDASREAIKLLSATQTDDAQVVTVKQYVTMRDYLLVQVVLANDNRLGVLSSMLTSEILNAREIDGHMVISVGKHKTAWQYGPAKIVLTNTVYAWLKLFMTKILPQISSHSGSSSAGYAFLTANGQPMESGQITRALQATWKKANLSDKITCTLVRKSAVTAVHQEAPGMAPNLADLMGHRTATAERCYRVVNREKTCVAAAKTLSEVTGRSEISVRSQSNRVQRPCDSDKSQPEQLTDRTVQRPRDSDESQPEQFTDGTAEFMDDASVVPPSSNSGLCKLFNPLQATVLLESCDHIIKQGPIAQQRITEALTISKSGQHILETFSMVQIVNRLKYERKRFLHFSNAK